MRNAISALALLTLAGTAMAQPAVFTDLGNRTTTQSFTQPVTLTGPSDIQWFRIVLPAVAPAAGHVDIWTTPTANPVPTTDMSDTEIGLYNDNGDGASTGWNDDDDGPGLFSALSYGSTVSRGSTTFGALTVGVARNGRDGALAGGTYWLAVGRFNVNFATGFSAVSTYTGAQTNALLNFDIFLPTDPFPPTGAGLATPATAFEGATTLLTVSTTPGGNPTNTVLTVVADLSTGGGSATQAFVDNGTGGDAVAGDGIFSYTFTVPSLDSNVTYTFPFTVTDGLSRSSGGNISFTGQALPDWEETVNGGGDAGQDLATAQVVTSSNVGVIGGTFDGADVDMYRINICDFANFSATTVGGTTADTQIFLFNTDGFGVTYNDDSTGLQSTITSQFITGNGDYYLAVSRYNIDPTDIDGALLWLNTPFAVERSPDGPAAANALAGWTGTTTGTAAYRVTLTGACPVSTGPVCGPADIGSTGGTPGADGRLDNNDFIVFIDRFFNNAASADIGTTGGAAGSDGQWNNNDFIVFIDQFFNGPASCR